MQKEIKIDLVTSTILVLILLFYVSVSMLNVPFLPVVVKYVFLFFMLLILILLVQKSPIKKRDLVLFIPFILFNFVYVFNLNNLKDIGALMIVINQASYAMVIYIIYNISWTKFQIKTLSYIYTISLPMLFVLNFLLTDTLNRNTISSFSFFLSFFPLLYLIGYAKNLKKSRILVIFILTASIIFATDSRAILTSAFFAFLTFFSWKFITKRKPLFNLYFFLILAFNYFVIVVYPKMYTWNIYYTLNELSLKYTDKPLLTGRNTIWSQLVDLISMKPRLGYGSSVVPEDFLSTSLSAHNLYLQIGLQTGIVGIFLLLSFFFFIWKTLWKNRNDRKVVLVSSFFIGIIVHQTFEVTLTQNQFVIGLLQWMIIGFGLHYSLNNPKKNVAEP